VEACRRRRTAEVAQLPFRYNPRHSDNCLALAFGTRLGAYEILSLIGSGGMGEVYRARDTKLNRDVALKILPADFALDADRLVRFTREAHILAALNHPNIAAIYGLDDGGGTPALVMELVDGPTLADRIARAPIPLDQALEIARQIADALEAAHEKAIVHRDLKPANIAFAADDTIKVLDFGLAKAVEPTTTSPDLTRSPTLSLMATQAGFILGTAAYMSPEQAKGLPADHRSDVFSFGVVLYEMLTRRQPFRGETAADILASVLVHDADVRDLSPNLNPRLPDLIRRCLDKNPKRRWQAMGDVRSELELIAAAPTTGAGERARLRQTAWWTVGITALATALVVGVLAAFAAWRLEPQQSAVVTRFSLILPGDQRFSNLGRRSVAISPDGTRIAYVANRQLFLRSLSDFESVPIRGTEGAATGITNPVFSPDGNLLAYWSDGAIRKVAVTGGVPTMVCAASLNPLGMSWAAGSILFSQGEAGILRVAAAGGQAEPLIESNGVVVQDPQFVLNEESVLFTIAADNAGNKDRAVIQSIPSGERRVVVEDASSPMLLESGYLLFVRGGVLLAAPFDARRMTIATEPVPVVEGVRRGGPGLRIVSGHYAVSNSGSLVYLPGPAVVDVNRRNLVMADLKGDSRPVVVQPAAYKHPRVSPDGRWLAVDTDDADASVYLYDLSGAAQIRRLTLTGHNRLPAWSPDSTRVTFQSDMEGDAGLFWQRADGGGRPERLTKAEPGVSHLPDGWTPDGKTLLFDVAQDGVFTLHSYSRVDGRVARFGDVRSIYPTTSVLSPDGRWLAYYVRPPGSASGSLVVQPFPSGERQEIVKGGGIHPLWIPHSQPARLLYRLPVAAYIVDITTQPVFAVGKPVELPLRRVSNPGPSDSRTIDVTPDGQHVFGTTTLDLSTGNGPNSMQGDVIDVVLNWSHELKQKVPAR